MNTLISAPDTLGRYTVHRYLNCYEFKVGTSSLESTFHRHFVNTVSVGQGRRLTYVNSDRDKNKTKTLKSRNMSLPYKTVNLFLINRGFKLDKHRS